MQSLILPAIHLSVLLGFIIYKIRKPFAEFMLNRSVLVNEGLNKSKKQALDVNAKKKEVEEKLSNLAKEKQIILNEWKEKEAKQILLIQESSKKLLAQMKIEADQNKAALEVAARLETIKEIGMLVVAQAEAKIKSSLNAETHNRLNQVFSDEVVGVK